jgi:DNA mismatch repair protein MutS
LALSIADSEIAESFQEIIKKLFGYPVKAHPHRMDYRVYSLQIRAFLASLGLGYHAAADKHIPESILQAPRPIVISFLQGLFDTDGYAENRYGNPKLSTSSAQLAQEVQMCLLNLGILSSIRRKPTAHQLNYRVCIDGEDAITFHTEVSFRLARKRQRNISYRKLEELITYCQVNGVNCIELISLQQLHQRHYFYDQIVKIEPGEAEVADLNVPIEHAFVANGFVNHNSTYMRQTALIILLAHIGSFVPAQQALIGPIDSIFTRIGASDDLAGGRSTFMVEMTETANILHNATHHSLVLMDEIGRGTSTFDGLSLAWACAEYLAAKIGAYTLFSTHYFELTRLPELFHNMSNIHLAAVEQDDKLIFMYTVKDGPANKSYGLQVALLAGVPKPVVKQARIRLKQLEEQQLQMTAQQAELQFSSPPTPTVVAPHPVIDKLKTISAEDLTPRQALELIYQLHALLKEADE